MNDARNDDSCCSSCCIICISSKHHVYKLTPIIIYKICRKARTKKVSELHQTLFFPTHNQKEKKWSGYETNSCQGSPEWLFHGDLCGKRGLSTAATNGPRASSTTRKIAVNGPGRPILAGPSVA